MKTTMRFNRARAWLLFLALAPALSLVAEGAASDPQGGRAAWRVDFELALLAAAAEKGPPLSSITRRMALAEAEAGLSALPADEAGRLCADWALQAERSLRFGISPQEARARFRQSIAFSSQAGGARLFLRELDRRQRYGFADQARGGASGQGRWTYKGGASRR